MATCLTVHAQKPKSHDLEAIKDCQVVKNLIFAMTAVPKTSKYATGKLLQCMLTEESDTSCYKYFTHTYGSEHTYAPLTGGT